MYADVKCEACGDIGGSAARRQPSSPSKDTQSSAAAAAAEVYWCTMSSLSELECESSERAHHGEGQGRAAAWCPPWGRRSKAKGGVSSQLVSLTLELRLAQANSRTAAAQGERLSTRSLAPPSGVGGGRGGGGGHGH